MAMEKSGENLPPVSAFIAERCKETEKQFVKENQISQEAIDYNDKLADHWQPGIKTRSQTLEETEKQVFVDMVLSPWMADRREASRKAQRALVIDLGGGNGKVVDWIDALVAASSYPVTYLYTDISPQMRSEARARFEAMRAKHPGKKLRGHFPLADATKPLFSPREWKGLKNHFFPIISVCAGGTIGNFGNLDAVDNSAQRTVFRLLLEGPDATLVTFLDPHKIDRSLKAYSTFGMSSGMYDGQDLRLFVADNGGERLYHERRVPFHNGALAGAIGELTQAVRDLGPMPCWLKLDMIKGGESVGQVTRHYSDGYVREKFLNGSDIYHHTPCDRARVFTCAAAH